MDWEKLVLEIEKKLENILNAYDDSDEPDLYYLREDINDLCNWIAEKRVGNIR